MNNDEKILDVELSIIINSLESIGKSICINDKKILSALKELREYRELEKQSELQNNDIPMGPLYICPKCGCPGFQSSTEDCCVTCSKF